jgi:hypothetical protein
MIDRALARFWSWTAAPERGIFEPAQLRLRRCRRLVRAYYLLGLGLLCYAVAYFAPHAREAHPDPLWPVAWVALVPWKAATWALYALCFGGFGAAAIRPEKRWPRALAAAGLFFLFALCFTYPGVQDKWYLFLGSGLILPLAPDPTAPCEDPDERDRAYVATVFAAFLFAMFTYSFAGFMKLEGIVEAVLLGDNRVLRLDHVPIGMYKKILGSQTTGPLAGWALDHPALTSLGMAGVVYLESLSLVAAFRPRLHRLWCAALISFHLGAWLVLDILFRPAVAMLALWVLLSPFDQIRPLSGALREIPGVRWLSHALPFRSAT